MHGLQTEVSERGVCTCLIKKKKQHRVMLMRSRDSFNNRVQILCSFNPFKFLLGYSSRLIFLNVLQGYEMMLTCIPRQPAQITSQKFMFQEFKKHKKQWSQTWTGLLLLRWIWRNCLWLWHSREETRFHSGRRSGFWSYFLPRPKTSHALSKK